MLDWSIDLEGPVSAAAALKDIAECCRDFGKGREGGKVLGEDFLRTVTDRFVYVTNLMEVGPSPSESDRRGLQTALDECTRTQTEMRVESLYLTKDMLRFMHEKLPVKGGGHFA